MKLPNGVDAIIDRRKVTEYCLSPDHDEGRHKAFLFQKLLGVTLQNAELLIEALRLAAVDQEAVPGKKDQYGQRYTLEFEFAGPGGTKIICSGWIIRTNELAPRLVTCYIS